MKKSIIKNYLYNVVYQILVIVVPLITTPYLSHVLGAEKIGIYSYTLSIATYFILFGTFGVAMYGQREIAYVREDEFQKSKTFFEILIMRFLTLGISLIIFYLTFCINGEYSTYYKILILEILANSLDISWFFQGLEEFKKTVARNTVVKLISVVCIFIFVKEQEDLYKYFLIYVLSTFIGNLSLWFYLPKFIQKVKFKELKIFKHLKPTIELFIPQIAIQIYTVLDKTMIGLIIQDKSEVGIYEQSQKIVKMPLAMITALGTVISPRIASIFANNKKEEIKNYLSNSFRFIWFLGMPMMFGIMAIAKTLVPWFLGNEFDKAKIVIMIGAPIIMAIGLSNVSGMQYLVPTKKQNLLTKSVIFGALFNLVTNIILIPILGAFGAMIASVLAEFLVLFIQLIDIKKDIPIKIVFENRTKYFASGMVMFIITFSIGFLLDSTIITTFIQIFIGIIVYGFMLIVLKDKMIYEYIDKIKNVIHKKKNGSIL